MSKEQIPISDESTHSIESRNIYELAAPILDAYLQDSSIFLKATAFLEVLTKRPDFPFCKPQLEAAMTGTLHVGMVDLVAFAPQIINEQIIWDWDAYTGPNKTETVDPRILSRFEGEMRAFLATFNQMLSSLFQGNFTRPDWLVSLSTEVANGIAKILLVCSNNHCLNIAVGAEEIRFLIDNLQQTLELIDANAPN